MSGGLAITPPSPAPSNISNHRTAVAGSAVEGVRWIGGDTPASAVASRARRCSYGRSMSDSSPSASRSYAMNSVGSARRAALVRHTGTGGDLGYALGEHRLYRRVDR
jgi:hypothetical protein